MNSETQATIAHYYQTFADALRARIRHILRDEVQVEDVLQAVFVKACEKWESLASHDHPYGWLYRVATTTAIDARRHRSRCMAPCVTLSFDDDAYLDPHNRDPQDIALAREHLAECCAQAHPGELALFLQDAFSSDVERHALYAARRRVAQRSKGARKRKGSAA